MECFEDLLFDLAKKNITHNTLVLLRRPLPVHRVGALLTGAPAPGNRTPSRDGGRRGGGGGSGGRSADDANRPHPPAAKRGIRTSRARHSRRGAPQPARAIDGPPLASKLGREEGPAPAGGLCGGSFNVPDVSGNKPQQNPTEEASNTIGEEEGRQELTE